MNRKRIVLLTVSLFFIITSILISCTKEPYIGSQILPKTDLVNLIYTDTAKVVVHTVKDDSLTTTNGTATLLGSYTDPVFGKAEASFVTEIQPTTAISYSGAARIDSIVLKIQMADSTVGFYGNKNASQKISVYRSALPIVNGRNYYSTTNPEIYQGSLLGSTDFTPKSQSPGDTIILNIKLDPTFGLTLLNKSDTNNAPDYRFFNYFNGLYIKSDGSNANLLKLDLSGKFTSLNVYFRDDTDTLTRNFIVSSSCHHFNMFKQDYTGTLFKDKLNNVNAPEDSVAFIQKMGSLRVRVDLPNIYKWRSLGKIALVKAELIVKTELSTRTQESTYPAISEMHIVGTDFDNKLIYLPEYYNQSYYPEPYHSDLGEYHFNIAKYLQQVIDGRTELNYFYIFGATSNVDFSRSVITTGKHSRKMRLVVSYIKL